MRFVPVKTIEQQSALLMHRARDLLIRQRKMLVTGVRVRRAERDSSSHPVNRTQPHGFTPGRLRSSVQLEKSVEDFIDGDVFLQAFRRPQGWA